MRRIPLCLLALAVSAFAADVASPNIDSTSPDSPDQAPAASQGPTTDKPAAPDATPPAPPVKLGGFVISGLLDGYFTLNFNHPALINNQAQNFDLNWGQPELSLGKITIDKSDKVFGFHVDLGTGETMRQIHAGDIAAINHKALRYEEQMYLILKPTKILPAGSEIDFGQFVTSAGAEVIEANGNWNYTRSQLFALAIPYFHFGVKLSEPLTKTFTMSVQVVNAWNTVWGNNDFKNIGITGTLTKPLYTWSINYYEGPNKINTTVGKRNLIDSTLLLTPNAKFNMYINGDYGRDNRVGGGYDDWYGLAFAAHYQATKAIAISPRVEFFDDKTGFNTGTIQVLKEGTIDGEYKWGDHVIGRVELRRDSSNVPYFNRGAQFARTGTMTTATLGVMYVFGPYK
jgi:hypothetical protein